MRIATFNTKNLFSRARVMNLNSWSQGRPVLNDIAALNSLLAESHYTAPVKKRIKKILEKYEFNVPDRRDRLFVIVEVREKLYAVDKSSNQLEIVADGRSDWVGWVELGRDEINGEAVMNTGRVISEVNADIQCVVEVESRITLDRFNQQVLAKIPDFRPFEHNMLIDGNDARGIDIGLLSRFPIISVRSHIDDGGQMPIFNRDCPEFEIALPDGKSIWILGNHFKSKGNGSFSENNAWRRRQATQVARIYHEALRRSDLVIVLGDLNDSPDSFPLRPLLRGTNLREVMSHPSYQGLPGTYGSGRSISQKLDYILLSPALWQRVQKVGVERKGVYAFSASRRFQTITSPETAASDHAAVWVDIDMT
ncbi:MAG: endonuclease/exonuclease/phosphatase family protein [candidate division KSB1 bacterium]|nr:endonuclease/exonuclease/phosphatase family protein [candidate division KSB1 bacterium]MDZ7304145.1 endonuclease/exonuclease/phosphatase family protein [candidate division KSB1 bacterium]MDZ7314101.1 endonuclease/exonuclease/phosphatase family protein [candidate division KSB1 bacterium]